MKEYQTELAVLDGELPVYTKNTAVNILTSYYISVAKENGIETTVSINIPEQLSIDRVDLTAILGNMWKNALDACRSLSVDVRKYIDTSIRVENGMLLIKCVNSSPETVKDKSGNFLSTKGKDHGNGLAIIEDTVERYGGFWKADYKDGAFTLTAAVRVQGKN
jgi:sensor histidine kinase regulating citrate/malate metabolism